MSEIEDKPKFFSLKEIAGWHIRIQGYEKRQGFVQLPALQRGAVWKPRQVEMLWDSLMQGFPIGSFLLAPFVKEKGKASGKYSQSLEEREPEYHLLDGQQRWNAITLAFINPWKQQDCKTSEALWIDLSPPDDGDQFGRRFVFRVVTRSHPWGYRRNDPDERLGAAKYREAITEYRNALKACKKIPSMFHNVEWKPLKIPLQITWPLEANAPVPFSLLIDCVEVEKQSIAVWKRLEKVLCEKLLFWNTPQAPSWMEELRKNLCTPTDHMIHIVAALRCLLGIGDNLVHIPALVVADQIAHGQPDSGVEKRDPIEILFERVNAGGTRLEGEELIYSMFKAIWPQSRRLVENMTKCVMAPSRLVVLATRVVLAELQRSHGLATPPSLPGVREFRRWVHGKGDFGARFPQRLDEYIKTDRMAQLIEKAHRLLALRHENKGNDHGLPPVLVTSLAQNSPDLFLLLLVWLDRHVEVERNISDQRSILLGALTTLHWFGLNPQSRINTSLKILWQNIDKERFWCPGVLKDLAESPETDLLLVPPVPPSDLSKIFANYHDKVQSNGKRWQEDNLWNFRSSVCQDPKNWYKRTWWPEIADRHQEAWDKFFGTLFDEKELLLYAQRHMLMKWFADYDPTRPDQLQDFDRPWDYDHILPSAFVSGRHNIPQLIKELASTVGNQRAWPMELNRSDRDATPRSKLQETDSDHKKYAIISCSEVRHASLVDEHNWKQWVHASPDPEEGWFPTNYLSYKPDSKYGSCRDALVSAILTRCHRIYCEWYETLQIKALF